MVRALLTLIAASGLSACLIAQAPNLFINATAHGVGFQPRDVILQDMDGASGSDIVTADSGGDTLTILLNSGTGSFGGAPQVFPLIAGDQPGSLAGGRFVGASGGDLAVACPGSNTIRLVDNTAGALTLAGTLSLPGTNPSALAAGSLNGGGSDDLVVALAGDLLGNGGGVALSLDGALPVLLSPPTAGFGRVQDVALGDLDGDGDLDVVATMTGSGFNPLTTDQILLYENMGLASGTFVVAGSLSVSGLPRGVCLADVDGNGFTDLAVAVQSFPGSGSLVLFAHDGVAGMTPGQFTAQTHAGGGSQPAAVACGDIFNVSLPAFFGRADVVTTNLGSNDLSGYLAHDGVATFQGIDSGAAGANPVAIALGDLDGDNTLEIVVANLGDDTVTVFDPAPRSSALVFGVGCNGTAGVPQISAPNLAIHGMTAEIRLTQGRPSSAVVLGVSSGVSVQTLLPGPCITYLASPVLTFTLATDPSGMASLFFDVPAFPAFSGTVLYFQYAVFDNLGAFNGILAFSPALRLTIGDSPLL